MDPAIWQTVALAAAGAGLAGTSAYFSPWVWRQRSMQLIRRQVAQTRTLFLTYDDGPSSRVTPQLLDLLRRRGARATFFMLGRNARQHPEIADQVIRAGHDIGCHSFGHLNAWKTAPWSTLADLRAGYEALSAWLPSDGMFRPPYGKMTLPTYWAIRRRGAPVWWWTINSGDTHEKVPSIGQVVDTLRRDGGGIVLMHDLDREKQRNQFVLELTDALLQVAIRESFKVAGLGDLCR